MHAESYQTIFTKGAQDTSQEQRQHDTRELLPWLEA